MTHQSQPDSSPAAVPVPSAGPGDDDDIIDAEIVEDPAAVQPTVAGLPEAAAAPASAAPGEIPASPAPPAPPRPSAPMWNAPPAPSLPVDPITDYTDAGVPTLSYLQDKVEKRYATALGSHELADSTIPEVQQAAKRQQDLAKSAEERLAEIRRSLHPDS